MNEAMAVAGMVLAAGAGTRMGQPKGLLRTAGTPWVARAAGVLAEGGCAPILAVTGAQAEEVNALVPAFAQTVVAADWSEGMAASLRAGLRAVDERVTAVIITLVDTPGVTAATVDRLRLFAVSAGPGALARAQYGGVPGHPVLIGRDHWAGVIATASGDAGARGYLVQHGVTLVECSDIGSGEDIDTPEELG
jgi:nicotine blue oxidoreductase